VTGATPGHDDPAGVPAPDVVPADGVDEDEIVHVPLTHVHVGPGAAVAHVDAGVLPVVRVAVGPVSGLIGATVVPVGEAAPVLIAPLMIHTPL
jgi:hypothetical protein